MTIHLFIEYRERGSTTWHGNEIACPADDAVFSALRSVEARGVPDKVSKAAWDCWPDDGKVDFMACLKRTEYMDLLTDTGPAIYYAITDMLTGLAYRGCETRVVYWFNN